jgi:hypothetical protein
VSRVALRSAARTWQISCLLAFSNSAIGYSFLTAWDSKCQPRGDHASVRLPHLRAALAVNEQNLVALLNHGNQTEALWKNRIEANDNDSN